MSICLRRLNNNTCILYLYFATTSVNNKIIIFHLSCHFKCQILVLRDAHFCLQYRRRTYRGPRGQFSPCCASLWRGLCCIYRKPEEWSYRQTWPHSTRGIKETPGQTETRKINRRKWSHKSSPTTPSANVASITTDCCFLRAFLAFEFMSIYVNIFSSL